MYFLWMVYLDSLILIRRHPLWLAVFDQDGNFENSHLFMKLVFRFSLNYRIDAQIFFWTIRIFLFCGQAPEKYYHLNFYLCYAHLEKAFYTLLLLQLMLFFALFDFCDYSQHYLKNLKFYLLYYFEENMIENFLFMIIHNLKGC